MADENKIPYYDVEAAFRHFMDVVFKGDVKEESTQFRESRKVWFSATAALLEAIQFQEEIPDDDCIAVIENVQEQLLEFIRPFQEAAEERKGEV